MKYRVIYAPEAEAQLLALFFQIAAAAPPEIAARYNRSHKCHGLHFADCETRQQGGANGLHGAMKSIYETGSMPMRLWSNVRA
jgi:hypothetical protein